MELAKLAPPRKVTDESGVAVRNTVEAVDTAKKLANRGWLCQRGTLRNDT